jgi:tetratricopeptide (TPR) repeat protein
MSNREKVILLIILSAVIGAVFWIRQGKQFTPESKPGAPASTAAVLPSDTAANPIAQYKTLFDAHPTHAPIALHLAGLYADSSRHEEAIRYYRIYLKLDTSVAAWEINLDIAREEYLSGNKADAKTILNGLERAHPEHPGVLYNVGALAANEGDLTKARAVWTRLLEVAPNAPEANTVREGLKQLDAMK